MCRESRRIYVGSSQNVKARLRAHLSNLRRGVHTNPKLQAVYNKRNSLFAGMLEFVSSFSDLISREQFWIDALSASGPQGFNIALDAAAPNRGRPLTASHKQKLRDLKGPGHPLFGRSLNKSLRAVLSVAAKARYAGGSIHPRQGKKHTLDALRKMSRSHIGSVVTQEHRAKISAALKGIKRSPQTREKMRAAAYGRFQPAC